MSDGSPHPTADSYKRELAERRWMTDAPRVLLTNDGIGAPGIRAISAALSTDADVTVVAQPTTSAARPCPGRGRRTRWPSTNTN